MALSQKPFESFASNLGRHRVRAVELAKFHIVAGLFERRDQAAATGIDRQDLVLCAVRDEDARRAILLDAARDEARREGHDRFKQVAIGYAETQGNGRTVGEAADSDLARIGTASGKDLGERLVDE